jgi:hypothetical protein
MGIAAYQGLLGPPTKFTTLSPKPAQSNLPGRREHQLHLAPRLPLTRLARTGRNREVGRSAARRNRLPDLLPRSCSRKAAHRAFPWVRCRGRPAWLGQPRERFQPAGPARARGSATYALPLTSHGAPGPASPAKASVWACPDASTDQRQPWGQMPGRCLPPVCHAVHRRWGRQAGGPA